jgi:hypothetical protein
MAGATWCGSRGLRPDSVSTGALLADGDRDATNSSSADPTVAQVFFFQTHVPLKATSSLALLQRSIMLWVPGSILDLLPSHLTLVWCAPLRCSLWWLTHCCNSRCTMIDHSVWHKVGV